MTSALPAASAGRRSTALSFVLPMLLLATVAVGCGSSSDSGSADAARGGTTADASTSIVDSSTTADPTTSSPAVAPGPAVPSPGCDADAGSPARLERRTLAVAELERWYLVTVPSAATTGDPLPLVLDFHGLTEGAEVHATMTGFGDLAESEGFVAVFPHGTGDLAHWAAGPGGEATGPNLDVDFVTALLDRLEADLCIDTSRVYATGLSNGSMFVSMLACRMAGRFAAVAPIAGATRFDSCEPAEVVPMLTVHGTADPILLFNGGVGDLVKMISGGASAAASNDQPPSTTIAPDINGPGYPANVAAWAERNGCEAAPTDEPVTAEVLLRTYSCPTGADVEMYIVTGGGHSWPGSEFSRGIEKIVGYTTFDIDATKLVWAFFQRFRRS